VETGSAVQVHIGKAGLLSFAGHLHEVLAPVSGTVTADQLNLSASSVDLTFAAARLRVSPEGVPSLDTPKVEDVMHGPEGLDVLRFPEIHFRSKSATGRQTSSGVFDLSLTGDLTLHGVTREISLPVRVTLEGNTLTATGKGTLRHDQFGMKPVSVAGGAVKVANEIRLDFRVVAVRR
jgi:polyisoprenoid-binding protein YceI